MENKNSGGKGVFYMNKTICGILVIIGIIASLVVPIEATTETKESLMEPSIFDVIGVENEIDAIPVAIEYGVLKYNENNNLQFMDGLKNGVLIGMGYYRDVLINSVCDYISGFKDKGTIGKIIWAVFGLLVFIKQIFFCFIGIFMKGFSLLTQKANTSYYVGYILGILIFLGIHSQIAE